MSATPTQQIDLYQEQFRPQRIVWPLQHVLAAALLLLAGLAGWYALERAQLGHIRADVAQARNDLAQWDARVSVLETQLARAEDPARAAEVRALRAGLKARRELLRHLEAVRARPGPYFSEYLEALSRQHQRGMWLTDIRIDSGGQQLYLSGSALRARTVPDFLRALSAETPYAGRAFSSLLVNRPADDQRRIDFTLSTRPGEASP